MIVPHGGPGATTRSAVLLPEPLRQAIPDAPFTTLLGVIKTYCRPDAPDRSLADLKALAGREDDEEMRVFKDELRDALNDPSQLPLRELRRAGGYRGGDDRDFLLRLWRDLYGDEPVEAAPLRLVAPVPADG